MGGGAGIEIEVELEQFYIRRSRNDRRKFIVVEQPVIAKWHAQGYDDGMRDVNGNLLKAKIIMQPLDTADAEEISRYFRVGDRIAAWTDRGDNPKIVLWPGYVRGKWQSAFPLSIDFTFNIEAYSNYAKATLVIEPADKERFGYFWEDVFDFIAEAEDEDEEDTMSLEQVDELHWENCEVEYGA